MLCLPAPRTVALLPAWCPPAGCEPDPYPYKAIVITTACGSARVNGYADIGAELAALMARVGDVQLVEVKQLELWELERAG